MYADDANVLTILAGPRRQDFFRLMAGITLRCGCATAPGGSIAAFSVETAFRVGNAGIGLLVSTLAASGFLLLRGRRTYLTDVATAAASDQSVPVERDERTTVGSGQAGSEAVRRTDQAGFC
jgi:hypothetical protein